MRQALALVFILLWLGNSAPSAEPPVGSWMEWRLTGTDPEAPETVTLVRLTLLKRSGKTAEVRLDINSESKWFNTSHENIDLTSLLKTPAGTKGEEPVTGEVKLKLGQRELAVKTRRWDNGVERGDCEELPFGPASLKAGKFEMVVAAFGFTPLSDKKETRKTEQP